MLQIWVTIYVTVSRQDRLSVSGTQIHYSKAFLSRIEVQLQKTLPGLLKSCSCGRVERQPSVFLFGGLPWQLGHRGRGLIVPGMNPWESPKAPFNPGCSRSVRSTLALYLSIAPSYAVNGCSLTFMAR